MAKPGHVWGMLAVAARGERTKTHLGSAYLWADAVDAAPGIHGHGCIGYEPDQQQC